MGMFGIKILFGLINNMRWTFKKINKFEWHETFLWFPRKIDGYWVWLEFVERQKYSPKKTDSVYTRYRLLKEYIE